MEYVEITPDVLQAVFTIPYHPVRLPCRVSLRSREGGRQTLLVLSPVDILGTVMMNFEAHVEITKF